MKYKLFTLYCLISMTFVCTGTSCLWAKAPDTPKIVFSAYREENRDIYLMNPDGRDQINITQHKALDGWPAWSPTGDQILFSSDRGGVRDLYLMDPDGSNVQKVFGKRADRTQATWSPDGKQIAYRRREPDGAFVYIATIDGKKEEKVAFGSSPDWSPDGEEIAFLTGWPKRMQITVLDVNTRKQKIFFPKPVKPSWMTSPAWSPAGGKIAFSWIHQVPLVDFVNAETIYIINRDGTGLQQVIQEGVATSPIWSPQGDVLLYNHRTKDNNQLQIYKIELNGDVPPKRLTNPKFWHAVGDWFDPAFALSVASQMHLLTTVWSRVKQE